MRKLIVPSILSADFTKLGDEIRSVKMAGADWIHVDVMDGHFVPNISIGIPVVEAMAKIDPPPLDIHLQIENAERFVDPFIKAGGKAVKLVTVQADACRLLHSTVARIKSHGVMAGVALSPSAPISSIEEIFPYVDLILVMTVEPGFPGQKFIESMIPKVRRLRELIEKSAHKPLIEVDGGIKLDNIHAIAAAGADAIVSGSGIFGAGDYQKTIELMRREIA